MSVQKKVSSLSKDRIERLGTPLKSKGAVGGGEEGAVGPEKTVEEGPTLTYTRMCINAS